MAVTHDQQIAALKAEIECLKGEIKGLQYAVSVRPYQIYQYVPTPAPRPIPTFPMPTYPFPPNVWYSQSAVAQGDAGSVANNLQGANN